MTRALELALLALIAHRLRALKLAQDRAAYWSGPYSAPSWSSS